jgi:hypothetical protein
MITVEQLKELKAFYNITDDTDTSWQNIFEFDDQISVKNNPIKARDALHKCLAFFIKKDGHIKGFYVYPTILLTQFKMIQQELRGVYASLAPQNNTLMLYSYGGGNFSPIAFNTFLTTRIQLLSGIEYYQKNPPTVRDREQVNALLTLAKSLGYNLEPQDPLGSISKQIANEKTIKKSLK